MMLLKGDIKATRICDSQVANRKSNLYSFFDRSLFGYQRVMFKIMILSWKLLCLHALIGKTISDSVSLSPYDHKDSNTQCSKGLLIGDTLVLHGTATFRTQPKNMVVLLEMHANNITLENISLKKCTGFNKNRFSCKITSSYTINTLFNATVSASYSKIKMHLVVIVNDTHFSSPSVDIPEIYDQSNIAMTLYINNESLSHEFPNVVVNDKDAADIVACCSNAPEPCIAVISDDSSSIITESETCVTYKHISNQTKQYKIGYKLCMREFVSRYFLQIKSKDQQNETDMLKIGLTLNGQQLTEEYSNHIMPVGDKLLNVCCVSVSKPCSPVISDNTLNLLNKSVNCVTYHPDSQETKEYKIGYILINHENRTMFTVRVKFQDEKIESGANKEITSDLKMLGLLSLFVVYIISICGVIILKCRKKYCFSEENGEAYSLCTFLLIVILLPIVSTLILLIWYLRKYGLCCFKTQSPTTKEKVPQEEGQHFIENNGNSEDTKI
ncbi:hypothetical protein Btru_009407 [Bulinus truncatus]|nr:hypothetical protein Btru_009407 [Bulinus truncatus]